MSQFTRHEDPSLDLAAEVFGTLPPEESAAIDRHLESCPDCAAEIGELRDAAALLASVAPPRRMEAATATRIRVRLLDRAAAERLAPPRHPAFSRPSTLRIGAWSGWLVAAGLASLLLTHHSFHRPIAGGWLVAGMLAAALILLTAYALRQRRENAQLRNRLDRHGP